MKTLFVLLFLAIFFILSIPLFLIETIIGIFSPHLKIKTSQKIVVCAFRFILFVCGVRKTVIGLDRIPKNTAVLYVSNHRSYFDILIAYTSVPTLTGFVAKKEMNRIPFLRVWMRFLNCLFLDRNDIKQGFQTTLKGIELLKKGYSVFIAPEGTRNQRPTLLPFKEGSFKMAEKANCPVVPVVMTHTDDVFERHIPWIRKAHVTIEFGDPIYPDKLSKKEQKMLGHRVQDLIQTMFYQNEKIS